MKIYNPNISKQTLGGGHTFRRNLEKALKDKVEFVNDWEECDIYFITSVTIVDKAEVRQAKASGKKIVLRVDNMPRKSRNRRMSPAERMKGMAEMADKVVFQSEWAQEWIGSYLGCVPNSTLIYNGVDTDIFNSSQIKRDFCEDKVFMYVQYNRDENKRMPEAFDMFTTEWIMNAEHVLWIVGQFSPELVASKFDFFRGEKIKYYGVMDDPSRMATLMRQADVLLYPSYSDSCPNTVIEAKACGMDIRHNGHAGVKEAVNIKDPSLERMGGEYLELFKSL